MPRLNGMELLQRLPASKPQPLTMPVIFLTSKDEEVDEIMGLRMGADDYITKPLLPAPLHAGASAPCSAGEQARQQPTNSDPSNILVRGEMTLDSARHVCAWKGKPVDLTVTEFLLVKALAQRPGHVKSRDQLMDAAYGSRSIYVDDRTIDSHIKRLRKKFKELDGDFAQIETLYGVGYKYRE